MDPEKIVRQFCEAVAQRDLEKLAGFFTDDAVYHNIPIDPVQGREAIGAMLGQFLGPATKAEFEILAIACAISAWRDYFDMAQFTSQMG
jgi:limonene-1,2-epoxide hydrolase